MSWSTNRNIATCVAREVTAKNFAGLFFCLLSCTSRTLAPLSGGAFPSTARSGGREGKGREAKKRLQPKSTLLKSRNVFLFHLLTTLMVEPYGFQVIGCMLRKAACNG